MEGLEGRWTGAGTASCPYKGMGAVLIMADCTARQGGDFDGQAQGLAWAAVLDVPLLVEME
jgi:hypothetical protein